MPPVRPAEPFGAVGLILPTLPQGGGLPWTEPYDPAAGEAPGDPLGWLAGLCAAAEAAGAGTLWACDHLYWHGPVLECTVALTVAATATTSAALGSCVVQLPLRRSAVVAKQASTLQLLSGGRLILGVGVGSHPGEYDQAGSAYHTRGHDLDTGIDELRRAWRTGRGVSRGDTEVADGARYRQLPASRPVPVWVGGSSAAARRRAATRGDGWMPLFLTVDRYAEGVEHLAKETELAGRDPADVVPAVVLFVSVGDDPADRVARGTAWMGGLYGLPPTAFGRHLVAGTADEVAGVVARYRAAGAEHVALYVTDDDPMDQFARLAAALPAAGVPL